MELFEVLKRAFRRTVDTPTTPVRKPVVAPAKRSISRSEYEAKILFAAKMLAGGQPVNAGHLHAARGLVDREMKAKNVSVSGQFVDGQVKFGRGKQSPGVEIVGSDLSGYYVMDESGNFLVRLRRGASKVSRAALEAARRAAPLAKYAAPLILPAVATPFLMTALRKPRKAPSVPAEEPAVTVEPQSSPDKDELEALTMSGSSADAEYAARMLAEMLPGSAFAPERSVIPHETFRAAVWQRAVKLCRGGRPTTRCLAAAEKSVRRDMKRGGLRVGIPGGRPARVTR